MKKLSLTLAVLCAAVMLSGSEDYRIIVDSVVASAGKTRVVGGVKMPCLDENDIKEYADAGFTHLVQRHGFNDKNEITLIARECAKNKIRTFAWMRGALEVPAQNVRFPAFNYGSFGDEKTPKGKAADGKRYVARSTGGEEQIFPIFAPDSDEFWNWLSGHLLSLAELGKKEPALCGVILDFEDYYSRLSGGFLYHCSYDKESIKCFYIANKLDQTQTDAGYDGLKKNGLISKYTAFQAERLQKRAKNLRQKIDSINPEFQILIYPAEDTFMLKNIVPALDTPKAPVILLDCETYTRHCLFSTQDVSLEIQAERLKRKTERIRNAMNRKDRKIFGGIDPAGRLIEVNDGEYCAGNAAMSSAVTGGYWVFYEGVSKTKHPEYLKAFAKVNKALVAGDKSVWKSPRKKKEMWLNVWSGLKRHEKIKYRYSDREFHFPEPVKLRRDHAFVIVGKAGKEICLTVRQHPVGKNWTDAVYSVLTKNGEIVSTGIVPFNAVRKIRFTPKEDGILYLGISSAQGAISISDANAVLGVDAGAKSKTSFGIEIFTKPGNMYFRVPAGTENFSITARCTAPEWFTMNIKNAADEVVASGTTQKGKLLLKFNLTANAKDEEIWSIEIPMAVEDIMLHLDDKLPGLLGFSKESLP